MSSSSIFDSDSKKSFNWKIPLIIVVLLGAVFSGGYALYERGKPREKTAEEIRTEKVRDAIAAMLAQPTFSGDDFEKQILGKGKFQWLDRKKGEAYFSYPDAEDSEFDEFAAKFFIKRDRLEMAKPAGERLLIGEMVMRKSPETKYFFKTTVDNFKVDPNQTLTFPFDGKSYSVTLDESADFTDNTKVYGGKLIAEGSTTKEQPKIIFANHGIMVAKPNEPTLKRFVDQLLNDESIANDREKRIQKVLDFVSKEIEYSYTEAVAARELLKRPNEVLMTRIGDCSNKTILLASLLEQIGEDYILLYCPRHITVAVPQGNFVNDNKLDFDYEGKRYLIAESTLPGFEIGKTKVAEFETLINVNYAQSPRQIDLIFDAKSFTYLKFW